MNSSSLHALRAINTHNLTESFHLAIEDEPSIPSINSLNIFVPAFAIFAVISICFWPDEVASLDIGEAVEIEILEPAPNW